jgi:hypothetical protein
MTRGCPNGIGARHLGVVAMWAALALAAPSRASAGLDDDAPGAITDASATAERGDAGASDRAWFSIGLLTGTTQFDAGLADYQWDTTPRPGWGVRALVGRGRFAGGLRAWRTSSNQSIGDLGAALDVHATSWELVGEARLAEVLGIEVLANAGAGQLRLSYDPERITIQPPGPVSPIVVDLAPVGPWIGGGGVALRRAVAREWTLSLGVDARVFAIDAAHRAGDEIVYGRESFGDWSARFELAWRVRRR